MKKVIALILSLSLILTVFNFSFLVSAETTVVPAEEDGYETVTLTGDDIVLGNAGYCTFNGLSVTSTQNSKYSWVQFSVALPQNEYITDFSITVTNTVGKRFNLKREFSGIFLSDDTKVTGGEGALTSTATSEIAKETTKTVSATLTDEYLTQKVSKLYFYFQSPGWSTGAQLSLTVESVTYTRKIPETETITLTGDDLVLGNAGYCYIDGHDVSTDSKKNPFARFSVVLPQNEYITDFSITINNTSGNRIKIYGSEFGIYLSDNSLVLANAGALTTTSTSYIAAGESGTASRVVADDYLTQKISKLRFAINTEWSTAAVLTFTVESVTYTRVKSGLKTVTVADSEITLENKFSTTINANVATSSAQSPQFRIVNSEPVYTNKAEFTIANSADKDLASLGMVLNFADGTSVNLDTKPSVSKGGSKTVSLEVPTEYVGKKLANIELNSWYNSVPTAEYNLTITDYKLYNVPSSQLLSIIDILNSPITYSEGVEQYEGLSNVKKSEVDLYVLSTEYAPSLSSVVADEDEASVYNGKIVANANMPLITAGIVSEDYYISELGVIAIPTATLADGELTVDLEGIKKVYKAFESTDDNSAYASFIAPVCSIEDYSGTEITVKAYAIYTDGTDTVVYYSNNNDDTNNIVDGVATITCPTVEVTVQIIGDVNSDNVINILDLVRLKKYIAEIDVTINFVGADCNADGVVNAMDLTALRRFLLTDEGLATAPYAGEFVVEGTWSDLVDDEADYTDPS